MKIKHTFILLFIAVMMWVGCFSVFAVDSTCTNTYQIDNVTIVFEKSSTLTSEQQEQIAYNLVYGNQDITTYGLWCNLFGHDYNVETVYTITHTVNPVPPRCLEQVYQVSTCTRCEHSESVLIGSYYINCCP